MAANQQQATTFSELSRFCREGLYDELRCALYYEKEISVIVSGRTQRGNTLLHEAVEFDHPDIVQLLLIHGFSPNVRAKAGLTPLHVAASKGHVGCVKALLENSADVMLRDDLGQDAFAKAERSKKKDVIQKLLNSRAIVMLAEKGETNRLEKHLNVSPKNLEVRDLEEALLTAIRNGNDDLIPLLIVSGARRLDCALYLAIQLERIKSIAMLLLCKATITGDCQSIRSLLSEPPDKDSTPWYMKEVHVYMADMHNTKKMSYPIAVSIMEKNYEATKELLLKTDLDMRRKQVEWSKLKLTLLHSSWMYSIAPWVVSLKLVNNHLRRLPEELFKASQLRRLDLSHNLLETIQASLLSMPNLEYLNLSHNHLKELPETENWSPQLLSLDLTKNSLHSLPTSIQYSSIEILILRENQFTAVPRCLCRIKTLTSLDLSHMPISSLPKEMENLDKLVNLNVTNASIKDMPGGGVLPNKIRGFFKARARSSKPCNYIKVVILCQSDIAKSVVYSRLRGPGTACTSTPDIGIFQWNYRPLLKRHKLHFNTWVLGSSTDYSPIYPCFFSPNALYLIIWDMTRTGEMREQIKPYLDLLARYVPTANILVMVILPEPFEAWADANFENLTKRLSDFFSKPVYRNLQYHGLGMMSTTNAVRDTAQVDVKQKIYEIASTMSVNGQQVTSRHFPENYFALISVIDKEQHVFRDRSKPGVLEENALWDLFEKAIPHDPPDRMELPVIVDFLQDAGLLMHFADPNDRLDQYYFVRPEWLYYTMLRVLRHALQYSERVTISYNELCTLADLKWNSQIAKALVRLMIRYAIVLPIKTQQFFIPHLLPRCSPSSSHVLVGSLRRQFAPKTKALPADLWYRIICRILASLHRLTEMKSLKKKTSSHNSGKSDVDRGDSLERPVETDEETDELGELKQFKYQCSLIKRATVPVIGLQPETTSPYNRKPKTSLPEVHASFAPDLQGVREPKQKEDEEPSTKADTENRLELLATVISPDEEDESSLDTGPRFTFEFPELEVCMLPDEMEGCLLIPPPTSINGGLQDVPQNGDTTDTRAHNLQVLDAPKSNDNTMKLGVGKEISSANPTVSLPPLGPSQALQIPGKREAETAQGTCTSLSPSTLLIENANAVPKMPSRSQRSPDETLSQLRMKRVRSAPQKKRTGSYAEPTMVDRGIQVWNTGMIYHRKDISFSVFPCSCEMSPVEERGIEVCSTRNTKGRIVLARLCKLIQSLLEERYPELFSVNVPLYKHELTQLAICPICIEKKERNPTNFLVETCVHLLKQDGFHHCRFHPETVPLRDLIPDYLIIDFPSNYNMTVDDFKFNQSRPLHKSIKTCLYEGTIREQDMAVKVHSFSDGRTITGPLSNVRHEMEMLFHLKHPNIVRTFGFCLSPPCVLLERAPLGNLQQKLMDTEQRVSRSIRFHIGCQVASALDYLHKKEIIYRTLKASSILVWSLDFEDEVNVKLTNFERADFRTPSGLIGKPDFAAYHSPEMLRYSFREEYTEKIDIYSFGMLLYELVTRWQPFSTTSSSDQVPVSQRPKILSGITAGYSTMMKLMQDCWNEDQTQRPTALVLTRALSHPANTCHIATSVLRDCISVRGCCYVPSVHQIWAYGEYNNPNQSTELSGESCEGTQVFIMDVQTLSVQASLELKEHANSIHTIDNKVWIGMTESCVHVYDTTTFTFTDRVYLKDSVTAIVDNETYVFIAQANGLLTYYPKLKFPKEAMKIHIGSKPIMSMILVGDNIWLGCGNEIIVITTDDDKAAFEKRWVACECDQVYMLVFSKDLSTVWSLVRGGTTITSWDSNTGNMNQVTNFADDLKVICCDLNLDPSYVRMSSIECIKDTLWVGLTSGAIVILTATGTPKVVTYFRAHKSTTKCLMEIPPTDVHVAHQDCAMILSGGYGEVSFISNTTTESNGVIMSWEALSARDFKCIANRYNKFYTNTSHDQ